MDLVSTRRVGLGVAGALTDPAFAIARAAAAGWETPLAAPVRRPAGALVKAAARRGALDESRLLAAAAQASSGWFDRALRALIEARLLERLAAQVLEGETLERVLGVAAEHRAGLRAADAIRAEDSVERLVAHVIDQPAVQRVIERALASAALEQRIAAAREQPAPERVLASDFAESATEQVLASDELREALASQTHAPVDGAGDQLRDRGLRVDDPAEDEAPRLPRRRAWGTPFMSFDQGPAPA